MKKKVKKINKTLDKFVKTINKTYTPKEVENIWNNTKPKTKENYDFLVLDSTQYHKLLTFTESDGHQFADTIELEQDALKNWRLKHYQERWMTKKDLETYYKLIVKIIEKL